MMLSKEERAQMQAQYDMRERMHKDMIDRLKVIRHAIWSARRYADVRDDYGQVARELESLGSDLIRIEDRLIIGN